MTPIEKAQQILTKKNEERLCLKAGVCPNDGVKLVFKWTVPRKGFWSFLGDKSVNGLGGDFSCCYRKLCPLCSTIWTTFD